MADDIINRYVKSVIEYGTAEEAMSLMTLLREGALRLDRHLADPRHKWNRVDNGNR